MVKVIGLCGSIGAGKGEVSNYLVKKHAYVQVTVGDVVRDYLRKIGMEITRDNSDKVSEEMRQKHGITYWIGQVVKKIQEEGYKKAIVDGVRLPSDNKLLVDSFGKDYVFFKVDASPEVRFQRLKSRARPGFPKTLEEFEKHEKRQNKMFKLDQTFKQINDTIDNSTTMEDMYERIEKLLSEKYSKWV